MFLAICSIHSSVITNNWYLIKKITLRADIILLQVIDIITLTTGVKSCFFLSRFPDKKIILDRSLLKKNFATHDNNIIVRHITL